ncbi:FUSC family protein [Amedibacillus sp. YH-ame10]
MPKIGKRILKSSLAVFLCFVIYLLRGEQGIVFYSCIAAVLCVQQSTSNTIKVARNRVEGTLIGGFIGMLVLAFEKAYIPHDFIFIQYALIAFMIIPIIYITVLWKKTNASYISCVVFMSICVSHAMDVNPYLFALDRIMDTLIGIFVALLINCVHIPYGKQKDSLMVVDFALLEKEEGISSYHKIKWNQFMERGASLAIFSKETPGSILSSMQGMHMQNPLLILNGAALYNIQQQSYHCYRTFEESSYESMVHELKKHGDVFVYCVVHNVMHIYYEHLHALEETFYEQARKQPYENYVYGNKPKEVEVLALMIIKGKDQKKELQELIDKPYDDVHMYINEKRDYVQLFVTKVPDYTKLKQELQRTSNRHVLHLVHHQHESQLQTLCDINHVQQPKDVMRQLHKLLHTTSHNKNSLQ